MKLLTGETEIASATGDNVKVVLTNKRVYEEIMGGDGDCKIIPLHNIDSFAVTTSQKLWLLIVGVLICLFGFMNMGRDKSSLLVLLVGGAFIAGWWFTRKIGAFIYSMSGRNEIFLGASAGNRSAITLLIHEVQETLEMNKK